MKNEIKFIDLFAGIGGIRLGFESACSGITNCKCVLSSEWDRFAKQTYQENFKDFPEGDIRQIKSSDIPDFDILFAGFPCQPFSIAGVSKKNSLNRPHGFDDETQGTLFHEIARIIKDKQPKAFFLENVKNLENHDKGRTFQVIRNVIENDLGYSFFYKVVNAKLLVPQNRARIYMIGFKDPDIHFEFPEIKDTNPIINSILDDYVPEKYTLSDHLWQYLQDYSAKHRAKGNGFGYGLVDINSHSRTLSARYHKDGSEILIPQQMKNPRRLTPRECARLMGFPENFIIPVSDTQAYRQFGNSVAVPIVEAITRAMIKKMLGLDDESTPNQYYQKRFKLIMEGYHHDQRILQ